MDGVARWLNPGQQKMDETDKWLFKAGLWNLWDHAPHALPLFWLESASYGHRGNRGLKVSESQRGRSCGLHTPCGWAYTVGLKIALSPWRSGFSLVSLMSQFYEQSCWLESGTQNQSGWDKRGCGISWALLLDSCSGLEPLAVWICRWWGPVVPTSEREEVEPEASEDSQCLVAGAGLE